MPSLVIKPYSISELSRMYEVDKRTLNNWMKPHIVKIGQRIGHYYTVVQVQAIFELLGTPNRLTPLLFTFLFDESTWIDLFNSL